MTGMTGGFVINPFLSAFCSKARKTFVMGDSGNMPFAGPV